MAQVSRSPNSELVEIMRQREQIDNLARALLPSRSTVFATISLPMPDMDGSPELAFIRTSSWLYVHYFEVGLTGVRFLVRRYPAAKSNKYGHEHLKLVHDLRTWTQHNIDPTSTHDVGVSNTCETWFQQECGTRTPRSSEHWLDLVTALLREANFFFQLLLDLLSAIEKDDDRDFICQQWEDRIKLEWPAHRFHQIIAIAAADLGKPTIDPAAFYDRHGHSIRRGMQLLSPDCDLEEEARRLIERALLTETADILPITGRDVLDTLPVEPGPQVGKILSHARRLYEEQPSDRETLLAQLMEIYT